MVPIQLDPPIDMRSTLSVYRTGRGDPTTRLLDGEFWRATLTPEGPGTLHIRWSPDGISSQAWGDGAAWLLARVHAITGGGDDGYCCDDDAHPEVRAAHRNHPGLRIGASGMLYHELLPVILAQRVTSIEANRQWRQLCRALGEPAPGPDTGLVLPPSPQRILDHPAWWFHPFGIEAKRADALRTVARHAQRIGEWCALPALDAARKLTLLPGIGPWTIGSAVGPAFGDPDAVPVGDYHIPNMVAWALAGELRGTDERMLELLQPYAGHRGRVVRLLGMNGNAAPKRGPRQRILPMHRW